MKLWEIKAQSLRLMFADTDVNFNEEEFSNRSVYENANTREKLIRMEDSIKRAIDTYYQYVGENVVTKEFSLNTYTSNGAIAYLNIIDVSKDTLFGYPTRIDAYIYNTVEDLDGNITSTLYKTVTGIDYTFDNIGKKIFFFDDDYAKYGKDILFKVWYRTKKINIPDIVDEMTYDVNDIYIPDDVQRMIPYFVKGELYEEDEPNVAFNAKSQYIQYLMSLKKMFSQVQTKVKRAKIFDK